MTTIYFIRHAEPDFNVHDDFSRPLTEKGRTDCALVTEFLRDKNIDVVLSSPYVRARDTVAPFAAAAGLEILEIEGFRERKVADEWVLPFNEFTSNQWADFSYKLENGECLEEVTARNIAALESVLREFPGKNIVIGGHGTAISTVVHHFDNTYGYDGFTKMKRIFPWVVKMEFAENGGGGNVRSSHCAYCCMGMEKIDLFSPDHTPDYSAPDVRTAPLGSLGAYKYTVIFARHKNKWLYCRHKSRDTFETAGGRIEPGETSTESARRELYEETGATDFEITPALDYSVHLPCRYANGQVFLAEIRDLGNMPPFEMAETALFDTIPDKMRFPKILPILFEEIRNFGLRKT